MAKVGKGKQLPEFNVSCWRELTGWKAMVRTKTKYRTIQVFGNELSEKDHKKEVCTAIGKAILGMWE